MAGTTKAAAATKEARAWVRLPSGRRLDLLAPTPFDWTDEDLARITYRDPAFLAKFLSSKGKIRSRRITGACRRHQIQVASAVKRAREMALLPYTATAR